MSKGWIGVDLDGTLAHYDGWKGVEHIGEPVPKMLARVRRWLREGREVRIFTARVTDDGTHGSSPVAARAYIEAWLHEHDLHRNTSEAEAVHKLPLMVTNIKDFAMDEVWDDRCVRVEANTGTALCASPRGLDTP